VVKWTEASIGQIKLARQLLAAVDQSIQVVVDERTRAKMLRKARGFAAECAVLGDADDDGHVGAVSGDDLRLGLGGSQDPAEPLSGYLRLPSHEGS
jgi:hypothetical protein